MVEQVVSQGLANQSLLKKFYRYRVLIFISCAIPYIISYFHRAAPAVVGTELIKDLALSPSSLGVVGSAYFWAYSAAVLPAGILADTLGSRKAVSAFVMLSAIGSILFGLGTSVEVLTIGRLLVGFGCGFIYIPALRIISDWYKPDEMATYTGILVASGNIGAMISATPLVFLMNAIGWRNSFHAVGVVTIFTAIMAYVIVRDKPSELGFPTPRELMGLAPAEPSPKVRMGTILKIVFSSGKFYMLSALIFVFYGTLMGIGSLWAGPYLQNCFGLSKQVTSSIIMMFPLGMVFGCPISGYLSDKTFKSRKTTLMLGVSLHILTYIPLIFFIGDLSTMSLHFIFFLYGLTGGTFVCCYACAKETFNPAFSGTAMGALNVFCFAGSAFFQNIIGLILGSYSANVNGAYPIAAYTMALSVCICALILGTIVFMFVKESSKAA